MTLADEDRPAWHADAACRGQDVSLWFPERRGRFDETQAKARAAKAICATCDVKAECLQWALDRREPFGIYGGMTPSERRPSRMRVTILCRFCGVRFPQFENVRYCSPECREGAADARMRARDRSGGWTNYQHGAHAKA